MKDLPKILKENLAHANEKTIHIIDIERLKNILSNMFFMKDFSIVEKNKQYETILKAQHVGYNQLKNPSIDCKELDISKFILKNDYANWHLPVSNGEIEHIGKAYIDFTDATSQMSNVSVKAKNKISIASPYIEKCVFEAINISLEGNKSVIKDSTFKADHIEFITRFYDNYKKLNIECNELELAYLDVIRFYRNSILKSLDDNNFLLQQKVVPILEQTFNLVLDKNMPNSITISDQNTKLVLTKNDNNYTILFPNFNN